MTDAAAGARPERRGRGLARNALYNVAGQSAPLAVAYFAIPVLTRELGASRFGLLTLAWAVLGYFSLFDLGLGRALTHAVADRIATPREPEIPAMVWTGLTLMVGLGFAGAALAALLAPWLVRHVLNVPPPLQADAVAAFLVLACSVPVVIVSAAVRGVLEAVHRFDLVNAIRIPQGILSFAGPLFVLPFSRSLAAITLVLLAGRAAATAAWFWMMLRELPVLRRERRIDRGAAGRLLRFGSWMTVSNVVSPLMVTLDRFVIGGVASVALVAYYTAPWEAITKLWLIPGALGAVLFPAFAGARAADPERSRALYLRGVKATVLALLPVVVVVVGFAREGLDAWLGAEYAARSAPALRWLALGVLVNSAAQIPFALIQGSARPDVTAKLHLAEFPAYLLALWWLVVTHGITGAAIAWTLRAIVDAVALFAYAQRLLPLTWPHVRGVAALAASGAAGGVALAALDGPLWAKYAVAAVLLATCLASAWRVALSSVEREEARALAVRVRAGGRGAKLTGAEL